MNEGNVNEPPPVVTVVDRIVLAEEDGNGAAAVEAKVNDGAPVEVDVDNISIIEEEVDEEPSDISVLPVTDAINRVDEMSRPDRDTDDSPFAVGVTDW